MFRPMRRARQELDQAECIRLLKTLPRGVLSLAGDDGYPYGIPMDHWYCEADGNLYFHGALAGHKVDAIARNDKCSFCVYDEGYRNEGEWALNIKSVVVFGRIRPVEDPEKAREICENLVRKFTDDEAYLRRELEGSFSRVLCLCLTPEHISGKQVNES